MWRIITCNCAETQEQIYFPLKYSQGLNPASLSSSPLRAAPVHNNMKHCNTNTRIVAQSHCCRFALIPGCTRTDPTHTNARLGLLHTPAVVYHVLFTFSLRIRTHTGYPTSLIDASFTTLSQNIYIQYMQRKTTLININNAKVNSDSYFFKANGYIFRSTRWPSGQPV